MCKNDYIWNPITCTFKNGKYLRNIIVDPMIMCDKILEATKTVSTKSPARQNHTPQKMSYGRPHIVLYVTPRDVSCRHPEHVLCRGPFNVEI